ncbi:MAG: hypothetical protein ACO3R6_07215, partial [Lutimaribacter sp.]
MQDSRSGALGQSVLEAEKAAEKVVYRGAARWFIFTCATLAIALSVNQLFNLRLGGYSMLGGMYLYLLAGLFLSLTFVCFRAIGPASARVPLYDWGLALLTMAVALLF